jgi:hypothetical protein
VEIEAAPGTVRSFRDCRRCAVRRLRADQPRRTETGAVQIGEGEIRWLKETFANQWRREPTGDELRGLVAGFLEEELLAREAKALGLDRNDTIVRRRLAQKLAFLVDDTSRIVEPTEEQLRQFYDANTERFGDEARISFAQVFFNPERRSNAEHDAEAALVSLSTMDNGTAMIGDPILLETEFHDVDARAVSNLFGDDFARTIFSLKPGSWTGPVKSGYGVHIVRISNLRPPTIRSFEAVRPKVVEAWQHARETEAKAAYLAKLREKYSVNIDDKFAPLLAPPQVEAKSQ